MTTLVGERCAACRKDSPKATEEEQAQLLPLIPRWKIEARDGIPRLERVFRFRNFVDALAFTNRLGEIAEAEGHHPAILTEWGRVTVTT